MKIQLDTVNKTIVIEEKVNLKDFVELVKNLLPNNMWEEYSLECKVITNWSNPWTYPITPSPMPIGPYYSPTPWVTTSETTSDGIYNIECVPSEGANLKTSLETILK